jgi:hypothetical protein
MKTRLYVCAAILTASVAGWAFSHALSARADSGFTLASVKGIYGYTVQGSLATTTPMAAVGMMVADGNGGLSGTETQQIYGQGTQTAAFQGSYTVNGNGSGTMIVNYPAPPTPPQDPDNPTPFVPQALSARYDFVIVNGIAEIKGIRSENGIIATAAFRAQ